MTDFTKRKIHVKIRVFEKSNEEQDIELEGLRISATIDCPSQVLQGSCQLSIWGMSQQQMDSLTVMGPIMQNRYRNQILVSAGDEDGDMPMTFLYSGYIDDAFANMNAAPNVNFFINSTSAAYDQVSQDKSHSYKGDRDVAAILQEMAKDFEWGFENHGPVSVVLRDRSYTGTRLTQVLDAIRDANINGNIDKGILRIWPRAGSVKGEHEISTKTGMIGYPTFSSAGVVVTTRFNPDIQRGQTAKVESTTRTASGSWIIDSVVHHIESEIPNGAWFTQVMTSGIPLE